MGIVSKLSDKILGIPQLPEFANAEGIHLSFEDFL